MAVCKSSVRVSANRMLSSAASMASSLRPRIACDLGQYRERGNFAPHIADQAEQLGRALARLVRTPALGYQPVTLSQDAQGLGFGQNVVDGLRIGKRLDRESLRVIIVTGIQRVVCKLQLPYRVREKCHG